MTAVRVGCGWDIHPLVEGRKLILGGLKFPIIKVCRGSFRFRCLGARHLRRTLGAMGEGDLGRHYPSSDQRFKNISSLKLLEDVVEVAGEGVSPGQCGQYHHCPSAAPEFASGIDATNHRRSVAGRPGSRERKSQKRRRVGCGRTRRGHCRPGRVYDRAGIGACVIQAMDPSRLC